MGDTVEVVEKVKKVLSRPKRSAVQKSSSVANHGKIASDEMDTEDFIAPEELDTSDTKKSKRKVYKPYNYNAPDEMKVVCEESQRARHKNMKEAFSTEFKSLAWTPDKEDIEDEGRILLAGVLTNAKKWSKGQFQMSPESKIRMMKGLLPLNKLDMQWVPKTYWQVYINKLRKIETFQDYIG